MSGFQYRAIETKAQRSARSAHAKANAALSAALLAEDAEATTKAQAAADGAQKAMDEARDGPAAFWDNLAALMGKHGVERVEARLGGDA